MVNWKAPVAMLPVYVDAVVAMAMEMAEQSAVAAQCFAAAVVVALHSD